MNCENCANAYDEGYTAGHNAELRQTREQAEALADALGGITYSGPICFPEDGGRCHWCEGKEAHGHADHCDWIRGDAALRTYREWLAGKEGEGQ